MFLRRRAERGQGSLESVGIVLLAAILVGSVTGLIIQTSPSVREQVSYRICQIVNVLDGGACEAPSEPRTAADRVPDDPCLASSDKISAQATASVVVTVRRGYSFLIEEMSDGTYKVTRVDDSAVGTGVGPGIDVSMTIDGKKYGVTAIAAADALLAGKTGETWYADDADDAEGVIRDIIANDIVDEVAPEPTVGGFLGTPSVTVPNPVNRAVKALIGDPGDPEESFAEGGLEGSAEGTLSGITASAGATIKAESYLGIKRTPDGYTTYFRTALNGEAYGAVIGDGATATGGAEVLTEVSFDDDGTAKSIKMTTGVTLDAETEAGLEDDQKYTETSVDVPLSGDLAQDAELYAAISGNPIAVTNLVEEARDSGYVTQNVYSQDPNTYGVNIGGTLLGEYGGSVSGDVTTRELQEARYWDGHGLAMRPDC